VPRAADLAALGAAGALLAGCGGGSADAPPAAFFRTAGAPTRRILSASTTAAATPLPSPTALLDWAERQYPHFFPGSRPDVFEAPYVYRHYPASGNYVGVAGTEVYVLGPLSGGELLHVGSVADFAAMVQATVAASTDAEAARFLQQAQFSSTLDEIAALRSATYEAWLTRQATMPRGESGWAWLIRLGHDAPEEYNYDGGHGNQYVIWNQMMTGDDQMRRRIALALSEYFVVSVPLLNSAGWNAFVIAAWWDLLCDHAFGNFRALLEAVTLSPAMGSMLNTRGNEREDAVTGRVPDENYAREVMQLFTIGLHELNLDGTVKTDAEGRPIETYDADDVTQLARVFTGYDADVREPLLQRPIPPFGQTPNYHYAGRPMRLFPERHSTLRATFLGTTVPAGALAAQALKTALDALFTHPNVGPFFGRQMIQRLVTSHPSPGYVERVARAFNDNGRGVRGDLLAVWRAILLDDEARGSASLASQTFGKLREPMLRIIQWGRSFGLRSVHGSWKIGNTAHTPTDSLGQMPFYAPSVFNFFRPGHVPPSTAMAEQGLSSPEFQIVNEATTLSYINFLEGFLQGIWAPAPNKPGPGRNESDGVDMNVDYSAELALYIADPQALMRRLDLVLCAGRLTEVQHQRILALMTAQSPPGSLTGYPVDVLHRLIASIVLLVMITPEYLVQQ